MKEKIPIILQKVCAGFPSPATDYVEDEINLNEELIVNKASTFLIRVQGNSMVNENIFEGDILVVDRSLNLKKNSIAVLNFEGQLVVKKMLKNKKRPGSIINMSSQLGHVGMSGRNVYNMTKFGIEGLTKGMGVELAKKNIRVNSVAPTFVETPMVKQFFKNKKFKKLAIGKIPLGKVATESDIATTVCFLASSASSMITGTSIIIDGGWTAQ